MKERRLGKWAVRQVSMTKELTRTVPALINATGKAIGGAGQFGDIIGVKQNTKVVLEIELGELLVGRDGHEQAKVELALRRQALRDAAKAARNYAMLTKELLKPHLGSQYSEAWDVTGLVGSLAIPSSPDELNPLMQSMKSFFTANPALEVAPINITAMQAGKIAGDIGMAQVAIGLQQTAVDEAMKVRDQKATKMRRRLRCLADELLILLDPLDSRWLSFGFPKPGASETPDVPENLRVTLIGNTAAALKWNAAPRAEYYRVWKRVVGVDEELVAVGSPADVDFTIEELPSNAEIEIAVSAVNNGGESPRGEPDRVRTT
jgi:hypothetical protein